MNTTGLESIQPMLSSMSSQQMQKVLSWLLEISQIQDQAHLIRFCQNLHDDLPIRSMAIAFGKINQRQEVSEIDQLINISYAQQWFNCYQENGLAKSDPVLNTLPTSPQAKVWSDIYAQVSTPEQKTFVTAARDFGLEQGMSFGHFAPREGQASFLSIATTPKLTPDIAAILMSLAPHLNLAALRSREPNDPVQAGALSSRESDILQWMKFGKTNWEIAMILGISERTVKFHVSNVIKKLSANNRAHAIALSMRQVRSGHGVASA
ncbi:LuxR C-terminal-related transcriptional regulator [Leeia sp.]|uniref:helix-turn-helix transcriptional regulator n=1 Tax=Leeia sp. TaxID=2884678 RepID=UPI0035B26694